MKWRSAAAPAPNVSPPVEMPPTSFDRRSFARGLLLILVAALALRVGYVLTVTRHDHHFYDAFYYDVEAATIADGHGFVLPAVGYKPGPAADHPPLTSIVLVPAAKLDEAVTWLRDRYAS